MKPLPLFLIGAVVASGCQASPGTAAPSGYVGIEKVAVIARGME